MESLRTAKQNTFIATLPRSGSTLLGMILDQHPNVYHAGETFFWGRFTPHHLRCSCGSCPCRVLIEIYDAIKHHDKDLEILFKTCGMLSRAGRSNTSYVNFSVAGFNETYSDDDWLKLDQYIDISCHTLDLLSSVSRTVLNKDIIVDNSKVIHLAKTLLTQENWNVVLLTRDVRGIASSTKHLTIRKGRAPAEITSLLPIYVQFAEQAVRLLETGHQSLHWVKYEDLCSRPEAVVRGLCDFLGISYQDSMLKFKNSKGHTLMGNRMRFDDNDIFVEDRSWEVRLTPQEQALICGHSTLAALYRELGYQM